MHIKNMVKKSDICASPPISNEENPAVRVDTDRKKDPKIFWKNGTVPIVDKFEDSAIR